MFVAMNRFTIKNGQEDAFEAVWRDRDSKLEDVPGFRAFHLPKGPRYEDSGTTLNASHTVWERREHFVDWTKTEHFCEAHRNAGDNKGLYVGRPQFEEFEAALDR